MSVSAPHFLLFAQATGNTLVGAAADPHHDEALLDYGGRWRFILQTPEGQTLLDAEDEEDGDSRERLELLAIVRGLEALDQPSQVTLVTQSRAISRGLAEGLTQWRENDWQWERFGSLTPIKNRDLWQRVDQAMNIHQVNCRLASGAGSDDLNLPSSFAPDETAAPRSTTRRLRDRQVRFDPGTAQSTEAQTAATQTTAIKPPPRRTRARQPAAEASVWRRAVSGVRQLFSR